MDTDLLTVARTLAERGWLPDMWINKQGHLAFCLFEPSSKPVTEADLHLSAHKEIVRRGWQMILTTNSTSIGHGKNGSQHWKDMMGTDTLALLRCLLAACEKDGKR